MNVDIIQQRILSYQCQTLIEQENALKEIAQEIALLVLSRAGFFKVAAFQGGTCLRILYGLNRFSEDLDFVLLESNKHFYWDKYVEMMQEEFNLYGYKLEVTTKEKLEKNVRVAFLKADSIGSILMLKDTRTNRPKLQIKCEIDVNPPAGSEYELKFLDFPMPYSVQTQNLPSLFAGKCHALLCRDYIKGRDWYDFVWYVARNVTINFELLTNALNQTGPWQNQQILVTPAWFIQELKMRINNIDWDAAKKDVARFLRPHELAGLNVWSKEFFLSRVDKLAECLNGILN